MAESKGNTRLIFQFVMLLLFLVVLPISSYFWMKGGTDYRKERMSQLKKIDALGSFKLQGLEGEPVTEEITKERMVISAFINPKDASSKKLFQRIELLQDQLEEGLQERKDILYLIHLKLDSLVEMEQLRTEWGIEEDSQFKLVTNNAEYLERLAVDNYKIDLKESTSVFNSNLLTLVDLQDTIRMHYDAMDNTDMGHLVEHMAIILPKDEKKDIIFKRDTEK